MSTLSMKTAKYYFIQGAKTAGYVLGINALLFLEWLVIGTDDPQGTLSYACTMEILIGSVFMVLMNLMFSVYGPNWYDSLVLSMGARRKDVFWGEIIKQLTYVAVSTLVITALTFISGQTQFMVFVLIAAFVSFILGPIGLIVGYSIKKFGKVVVWVLAVIAGVCGCMLAMDFIDDAFIQAVASMNFLTIGIAGVVLFILLELGVYKLNQKSMVR